MHYIDNIRNKLLSKTCLQTVRYALWHAALLSHPPHLQAGKETDDKANKCYGEHYQWIDHDDVRAHNNASFLTRLEYTRLMPLLLGA